jgi:hypothetical protein
VHHRILSTLPRLAGLAFHQRGRGETGWRRECPLFIV